MTDTKVEDFIHVNLWQAEFFSYSNNKIQIISPLKTCLQKAGWQLHQAGEVAVILMMPSTIAWQQKGLEAVLISDDTDLTFY